MLFIILNFLNFIELKLLLNVQCFLTIFKYYNLIIKLYDCGTHRMEFVRSSLVKESESVEMVGVAEWAHKDLAAPNNLTF